MPKDVIVPDVAEWYQRHGFTALIFDTYGIGAKNFIDSITFLSNHPLIDLGKIALWGLCFDGNIMLAVSATDRRIAAVISIAPMIDVTGDFERHLAILDLAVTDRAN
ncbi:peptidase S15 [Stemphylium lycopersici]|uniref:Peptidase S15 n=1 Tax=Stemphylium lycopersici TaxID=183478 RepID=A0A364MSV0_STELY|nr:peptidase S15 [Stemphylium lycopersici]RAR01393.1 peptidase S15 [Stemphylium lycopersici]